MYIIEVTATDRAIIREILPGGSSSISYSNIHGSHTIPILPGTTYEIETTAMRLIPIMPGRSYKITGCWMNYTKLNPPQHTLAITSAQLIEMPVAQPAQ